MTISLKHAFQSAKGDGPDPTRVQPSNWNAEHTITMATGKMLGRATVGTGAVEEIDSTTYGRSLLNLADAAAALASIGAASSSHTHTFASLTSKPTTISGYGLTDAAAKSQVDDYYIFIENPTDKDYDVVINSSFACTINEITTDCESGTCTLTGKINTIALGGTANSVSTTETTQAHASANSLAIGDNLRLTVSANAACLGLSIKVKYTRTLA